MIAVKGVELDRDCRGCVSCIFKWHGDGTNYCLAQSTKPFNLHHIDYSGWEKISKECKDSDERYNKQITWKEPSCPLVEVES